MTETANAASYFVDRHVAEGQGEKTAFREAAGLRRSMTYAEVSDLSGRAAAAYQRLGLRREERALLLVLDQLEFLPLFWGGLKAGVVPVPLNTLLATSVYDTILKDSRAKALFVSEELWSVIEPVARTAPDLEHIVVISEAAPEGTIAYDAFMDGCSPIACVETSPDDVAFWLYSSGSTGRPKGVTHVHSSLKATSDTYGAQVLQITPDDTIFSAAKFFFAYGLGNAMTFPMSVGATTVIFNGRPTPEDMREVIAEQQPTIFCGVPTLYAAMVALFEKEGIPKAPIRLCISAGEALPEEIGRAWEKLWGVEILDGVGSTEMLHIFLSNAPGDVVYGTSGTPVPGYDVRLVDEMGEEVGVGEIGELLVRGASASDGYWNQREKSRATFEGVWTRTGDKYERNAEERFVYCGRTDDMFKVSGIWVSPFEVEQALIGHPAVLEAAVVPAMDEEHLEKPKAFVVLKEQADEDVLRAELKSLVQDKIGKWKYPRWIEFVEDLPKTATGKIQRFKLRD